MKKFNIDTETIIGKNSQFWQAAGSDLLFWQTLRPEGLKLLDRMQQTGSCRYLRCHYTLGGRMIWGVQSGCEVYSEDENCNPCYDFSKVNSIFKEFIKRGIKPIVEYDYLPEELAVKKDTDAPKRDEGLSAADKGPNDWDKWKNLIKALTCNLADTFGLDEIRTWYFEVWNEPDHWPLNDLPTFFEMYDIFVDAVASVDERLRVGGPACYNIYFLRDFLNHVVNGTNHVTGQKGTRIDFISYHIYGLSGQWVQQHPLIQPTVQKFLSELLWVQRTIQKFPGLENVEFHINEWGVCSHGGRTADDHPALEYRNSEFSALFMVKLVHCLYALEDVFDFPVSLLLYWGFANEVPGGRMFRGMRDLVTACNIPKPIQTGFEMLSLLGDDRLLVSGPKPGGNTGLFATGNGENACSFVVYNFNELDEDVEGSIPVEIELRNLKSGEELDISVYCMDREHHNTYRTWQRLGSPDIPADGDIRALMDAARLKPDFKRRIPVHSGTAQITADLPKQSMRLYVISVKS